MWTNYSISIDEEQEWLVLDPVQLTTLLENEEFYSIFERTALAFVPEEARQNHGNDLIEDFSELEALFKELVKSDEFNKLSVDKKWCRILKNKNLKVIPLLIQKVLI